MCARFTLEDAEEERIYLERRIKQERWFCDLRYSSMSHYPASPGRVVGGWSLLCASRVASIQAFS